MFTIFSNIFSSVILLLESLLLSDILPPIFLVTLLLSPYILLRLRVFSRAALGNAPQRPNQLTYIDLAAALFIALATPFIFVIFTRRADILSSIVDLAVAAFIVFVLSARFTDGRRGLGISVPGKMQAVGFGVLLYMAVMPWLIIVEVVSAIAQKTLLHEKNQMHPVLKQIEHAHSPMQILSLVVMICIIAPIAEELFFRGLLQTLLIRGIAIWRRKDSKVTEAKAGERAAGIVIAAAIFAAVHLTVINDAWSWLPALFLLGVTLGYAYERTGKLWADITIHALFNAFAVSLIIFGHVGQPPAGRSPVHNGPAPSKMHSIGAASAGERHVTFG